MKILRAVELGMCFGTLELIERVSSEFLSGVSMASPDRLMRQVADEFRYHSQ